MTTGRAIRLLTIASLVGLFAFSFVGFAPLARATVLLTDCPNFGAITSASSGNPGNGFSVSITGTTSQAYSVTVPSNGNLIEICVYPNGGVTTSSTGQTTPIANWHAGLDCKGGGVTTCAFAERNTGTATINGPQTNLEVLDVTYTASPSTLLIALHVSQDSGSGICGTNSNNQPDPDVAGNPLTCFVLPSGGVFPPPGSSSLTTAVVDQGPGSFAAGDSVHDTATLIVSGAGGAAPTGTVTYSYFNTIDCTGTPQTSTGSVGGTAASPTVGPSATYGPLSAGSYSFKASYSGDSNYAGSTGACEPFTLTPPTGVPEFPIGMGLVLMALAPVLILMKRRVVRSI